MRSAYEKGYKVRFALFVYMLKVFLVVVVDSPPHMLLASTNQVYTLKDCVAATSMEAQEATLEHNFGMFSIPTDSEELKGAISA